MKHFVTLLLLAILCFNMQAQSDPSGPEKKPDRFFFGLTYNYLNADMKLLSMTKHSIWDAQDLGTVDVSQEDIDTINSYMDYTEKLHNINLSAGMAFLNKPGGHWYIDGRIFVGFNYRTNILLNTDNDTAEMKMESVHYSPLFGLGFNFMYMFNEKWGLNLGVNSSYAFGNVNKIDENIYPVVSFLEENRKNSYRMSYTMASLLASYTVNKFTIQAGPGFYFLFNRNEYHIVRSDEASGVTYEDSIVTTLRSDMFVSGYLQIGWRISDHFLLGAGAGIGKDFFANAGLIYFL